MNEKVGEVFSIANDKKPVAGCTISKAGLHSVKATKRFKMALLLTLE